MPYPIIWLENVFSSRQRAAELFAPELETGVLTSHDYELAVNFLPGYHRHYGFISIIGVMASTAYGYRKKWPTGKTFGIGTGVYVLGKITGGLAKLQAHRSFLASLDDPKGFAQACENTHKRMGGQNPLGFDTQSISSFEKPRKDDFSVDSGFGSGDKPGNEHEKPDWQKVYRDANRPTMSSEPPPHPTSTPEEPSQADADVALTSWDNIRKANSPDAKSSSWDAIRQNHERARVAEKNLTPSSSSPSFNTFNQKTEEEKQRAIEQAKFDALLEAERSNQHTE